MIDHSLVAQGTDAYSVIEKILTLVCGVIGDGPVNTSRASSGIRGGHDREGR